MERTLINIVKEIGVGMSSIVEFLQKSGFDVESKPNARISDEMYRSLLKEFQSSIAIKEKADQMIIGTRPSVPKDRPADVPKKETPVTERKFSFFKTQKEEPKEEPVVKPETSENIISTPPPVQQPAEPEEQPAPETVEEEKGNLPKLKIVGKIDLTPKPAKKEVQEEIPVKAEEPAPEVTTGSEPEVKTDPAPQVAEVQPAETGNVAETTPKAAEEQPSAEPEELMRAETPQLKGLKILGKIDTDKFDRPKKKPEVKGKPFPARQDKPATSDESKKPDGAPESAAALEAKKKKRKRKKVVANAKIGQDTQPGGNNTGRPQRPQQGGQQQPNNPNRRFTPRDEVKEVSQKEIDDKIKATMAKLSMGGKNKRQKIRRDSRDDKRHKLEMSEVGAATDVLQVTEFISVAELASLMDVSISEVITTCMNLGVIVSINQRLDAEVIELLTEEFGFKVEFISAEEQVEEEKEEVDAPEDLVPRAPIVTVMGHVDHGKTSLLDFIRNTNVAGGEAGGITQHIGAYEVVVNDKKITFLDTPGHEAFTAMRARGAKITDVAVIIIAADDSIMPQTREAISHAQAAGVPIVFAINKIDKAGADPERIKNELAQMNLLVEEWGGKYQSQDISAKSGTNVNFLLEKILLEAELLDLKANPNRKALGTVIEASLDKGRGYVTKMLVQNGSINVSDSFVAGEYAGKIKAMFNERGKKIKTAGPSSPVLVLGLTGAPQAGEKFKVMDNEQDSRQLASKRAQIVREQMNRASKRISLDEIGRRLALGTFKELNLIIKGDVDGSIEALTDSLIKQSIEKVQVNVIHKAVGQIIESDVLLASASDAIIIGFQVRPSLSARKLAEKEGVQIKLYSIIYEAISEIKSAIEGMLEPTKEENITGQVVVREVYKISKIGTIAGSYVEEGKISKNSLVRIIRDGIVIFPTREGANGELSSLKRFKEDVKDVRAGLECGITIKNFNDIKVGDVIESYEIIEVKAKLD